MKSEVSDLVKIVVSKFNDPRVTNYEAKLISEASAYDSGIKYIFKLEWEVKLTGLDQDVAYG